MALYYKYVEEYLQYSLISIAGKSKFSLEKYEVAYLSGYRVERLLNTIMQLNLQYQ
jgi:hypothetical protein